MLVFEQMTRDDKKLFHFQKKTALYELLTVDELGFVPLSRTGPSCSSKCSANDTDGARP